MFTGIIETLGTIEKIKTEGGNINYLVNSIINEELKVDQSLSHDGVCLTVTDRNNKGHWVTAVRETLERTNLKNWKEGYILNLERCMLANSRFDGHIVQGHVDQIAKVDSIIDADQSWYFRFKYEQSDHLIVEKGSITINGVSLTCFNANDNKFEVAIIPYTYRHTNFCKLKVGDMVNLEFDVIGKYVKRILNQPS